MIVHMIRLGTPSLIHRSLFSLCFAGQQTAKNVAIVLGGAVGLGFLVICLLFARSLVKKKDGELAETHAHRKHHRRFLVLAVPLKLHLPLLLVLPSAHCSLSPNPCAFLPVFADC
jgi:hypothetical protein